MKTTYTARLAILILLTTVFAGTAYAGGIDTDGDGIPDNMDNCREIANDDQRNTDGDDFGNRCDPDLSNDNVVNFIDLNIMKGVFFTPDADADFDGNGLVDFIDLQIIRAFFFLAPGPGAAVPVAGYAADVQPILEQKCQPCHSGLGVGGHDIATNYNDAFLSSGACPGLNIAECSLVRIQNGTMPQGGGCTGDPALDAGNAACLNQTEQDTVQAWINDGLLP